jgi:hypothetical protein
MILRMERFMEEKREAIARIERTKPGGPLCVVLRHTFGDRRAAHDMQHEVQYATPLDALRASLPLGIYDVREHKHDPCAFVVCRVRT